MKRKELEAIVRGLAPVIREYMAKSHGEVLFVSTRLAAAEAQLTALPELRDRVVTMETKALLPLPEPPPVDLSNVFQRLTAVELGLQSKAQETAPLLTTVADLTKEHAALRERIAVMEVKPALPGPQGDPGPAGKDGQDGTAGLTYQGVFQEGKQYEPGDVTTWAGSTWHCNEVTESKPGESKAWTLMVKRGRDGRDGKDAPTMPIVKVG